MKETQYKGKFQNSIYVKPSKPPKKNEPLTKKDYIELNRKLEEKYEDYIKKLKHKISLHEERWELLKMYLVDGVKPEKIDERMMEIKEELK